MLSIFAYSQLIAQLRQVILFIRPSATDPYIVCGPCSYVAHNAQFLGNDVRYLASQMIDVPSPKESSLSIGGPNGETCTICSHFCSR